jgi:hypothetical protein
MNWQSFVSAAINNAKANSDAELKTWEATEDEWADRELDVLHKHFAKAEVLGFERLVCAMVSRLVGG